MGKIRAFFGKTWSFIKKYKWSILLVLAALFVMGYFVWDFMSSESYTPPKNKVPEKKQVDKRVPAPLSGLLIEPEKAKRTPLAVIVENHPDARPQSGLNKAALVYETFAEGGITRFLAIFHEQDAAEIGPIRSARVYFVEWANSHKAPFAHVGGNADALDLIKTLRLSDLNQFTLGSYFWRDNKRYAPHNVYSTTEKLLRAAESKKYATTAGSVEGFVFKEEPKVESRPVDFAFKVNFNASFAVTYSYVQSENSFKRSIAGVKHLDRPTGEQVTAKNVIVCFSEFSNGKSRIGEQKVNIRTLGTGKAIFYIDGVRTEGTWKRPTQSSIMRYYDAAGAEVKLSPGTTWIDFVPQGTIVG